MLTSVTLAATTSRSEWPPRSSRSGTFPRSTAQLFHCVTLPIAREENSCKPAPVSGSSRNAAGTTHDVRDRMVRKYQYDFRPSAGDALTLKPFSPVAPCRLSTNSIAERRGPLCNTARRTVALGCPARVGGLGFSIWYTKTASRSSFVQWLGRQLVGHAVLEGERAASKRLSATRAW